MLTKLSKQLSEFGLSQNEIAVYVVLLQIGSETASNIAKQAKLNRSTTYVQLESLINYGLVSSYKKIKKTYFSAESPQNVTRLIETKIKDLQAKKDNIEDLIPDLLELYSSLGEKPNVRTFEGREGFRTMRSELIDASPEEFYVLVNIDQFYRVLSREELESFSQRRSAAGIKSYNLYNKKGRPVTQITKPQRMVKVDEKKYPFNADIYVYDDTISMASTSGKIMGVTIKNKQIAESLRSLFKLALTSPDYETDTNDL